MASDLSRSFSNPNLAAARKNGIQDLDTEAARSIKIRESLATPMSISSPRLATAQTSVVARAKAFEARAQAGRAATTSPTASPPLTTPFNKSIGARILVSQGPSKPAGGNDSGSAKRSKSATRSRVPSNDDLSSSKTSSDDRSSSRAEAQRREDSPPKGAISAAVSTESLSGSVVSRKPSLVATEGVSSEDDRTPRQSTNYTSPPTGNPQITRTDSSRETTNYNLRSRTYSPEPEEERRGSGRAAPPPRLPKLYFEGSLAEDGSHPSMPSARSIRSPYHSPNTEIERAGWSDAMDDPGPHKHGQSLAVPVDKHQGQIVDSPPPEDLDARECSFFWHSPNDTDETDDDADIEDNPGGFPSLPIRSNTNMAANVFGPGGPSDWEHFYGGDYETNIVDDTDLYLSTKEKDRIKREEEERVKAALESRRKSEGDKTKSLEPTLRLDESRKEEDTSVGRLRAEPALPTIQETLLEDPQGDIQETEVEYEADTLEGFAHSPAPATPASFHEHGRGADERTMNTKGSQETVLSVLPEEDEPEDSPVIGVTPAPEEEQRRPHNEAAPTARGASSSRSPPPPEIKMPETPGSVEGLKSGSLSPAIDDPNAGHITISMVLPADFTATSSPPNDISHTNNAQSEPNSAFSSPPSAPGARKSVFPQADELANPYSGLSPMAKASLNRFVRMLKEEEKADSDQDKFFVFLGFAQHEMKLRATLYDMDDEEMSLPASKRASVRSSINRKLSKSQPGLKSKPLPASPATIPSLDPTLGRNQSIGVSAASRQQPAGTTMSTPLPNAPPGHSPSPPPTGAAEPTGKSSNESFVMVDSPNSKSVDESVPLPPPKNGKGSVRNAKKASLETLNKSIDLVAPRTSITSDPSVASESKTPSDRSHSGRESVASSSPLPGAQILEHSLSVKANESKPYDGDKATNRQSIYRPFSGMLRSSSSHRRASVESVRTLRSTDRPERTTTDPVAIAAMVDTHLERTTKSQQQHEALRSPTSRTSLEPLMSVVPQSNVLREEPQQLIRLRFDMDNIVDDFSFIHKTVLAWDSGAKVKRERYEHERQLRLAANERRVEDLFDDNEIGYADIGQLEAEFKQNESVKKAEEEREEVESFVASVFDVVWARINYEMDQLTPLYQEATRLVAEASAGKQMFEITEERVPIAPIMEVLLILYQKLMIRHQKAFEAVLERDRRLKKTEVSPWFAIGQIDKVKRIEKRFEDAEKKAILEFCRQRDERANLLMDVLDQHTLRGVGANQDYMESVMQAVRKIAVQLAKGDAGPESPASADEVLKTKYITIALSRSSELIVRTFHIADMLLNAADYEVSVANAKLSNADAAAFRRLREAKAKEDAKLAADLEHRLGLIKGDTQRTQEEVAKLMALLDQEDPDLFFDLSRERDKRMIAALSGKTAMQKQDPQRQQSLQIPQG